MYGPKYKTISHTLTYKENRANRRVGKYSRPYMCTKCQASGDEGLVVYLRNVENCRTQYKYGTEEGMLTTIQKGNSNVKKIKQRVILGKRNNNVFFVDR